MSKRREKDFLCSIRRAIKSKGYFYYKLADSTMNARFTVDKPFDSFTVIEGVPVAIEGKAFDKLGGASVKELRESQVKGLEDFQNQNSRGKSFVFFYYKLDKGWEGFLAIEWNELRDRGLIPKTEVEARLIKKKTSKEWDLSEVFPWAIEFIF